MDSANQIYFPNQQYHHICDLCNIAAVKNLHRSKLPVHKQQTVDPG